MSTISLSIGTRWRWLTAFALTGFALAVLALPGLSDTGWKEIEGTHRAADEEVDFLLRYRDLEAQLTQSRGGKTDFVTECRGRRLTETYGVPPYTIVRETDSERQCFDWATGSLLGFERLRSLAGRVSLSTDPGVPGIVLSDMPPSIDWLTVTLASGSNLPLAATSRSGLQHTWEYLRIDVPATTVEPGADTQAAHELYRSMSLDEVARIIGSGRGVALPSSVAELPLISAFSYVGGELDEARYYVIWGNATTQVQLVVSPGQLPPDTPTVEDLGPTAKVLNAQDGERHWQIFAPDGMTLAAATKAIRPDFAELLP